MQSRVQRSTEGTKTGAWRRIAIARKHASGRSRACGKSGIAAEHGNAGAILGAAKRDHVLANMAANEFPMLSAAVG